jgi:hypothetical protein
MLDLPQVDRFTARAHQYDDGDQDDTNEPAHTTFLPLLVIGYSCY